MREITWETAMKIEAKLEELAQMRIELTAYQIAKDNGYLRRAMYASYPAGWTDAASLAVSDKIASQFPHYQVYL